MNNQSAQTMPGDLRWKIDTLKPSSSGVVCLTQKEWAYVAAALSQTAGMAEGRGTECEKCGREAVHYLVMDNLTQQGRRMPFCEYCTREHEETAREVNDHESRNFGGAYGLVAFHYEPLAAAPAASGGEYPGCSGDPASCPENEGHGCCKPNPARHVAIVCDWKNADPFPRFIEAEIGGKSVWLEWRDRPDGLKELIVPVTAAPQPPSAASVSEDAAFEAWFSGEQGKAYDGMWSFARAAWMKRAALEQALAQQRGSVSYNAGMAMHWIDRYAAGIDEECQLDRIAESFPTTPQPGAEAMRELVQRLRECAKAHEIKADRPDESTEVTEWHAGYGECATFFADELESLLGRGGK